MSLIDEALKRAQAAHQDAVQSGAPRPWTPAILPERHRIRRRQTVSVLAGAFLLCALVGTAFLLFGRKAEKSAASDSKPSAAPAELPPISSEVTVPPPAQGRGVPAVRIARPGSLERRQPAQAATSDGAAAPAAAATPSRPAGDERTPRAPAAAKTYVGEFAVPGSGKIELGGIVFSETNPVALINGKVLSPGSIVEGFTVVQIQNDRIELRGNGVTIFLIVK